MAQALCVLCRQGKSPLSTGVPSASLCFYILLFCPFYLLYSSIPSVVCVALPYIGTCECIYSHFVCFSCVCVCLLLAIVVVVVCYRYFVSV